jgi:hypothetical protein
MVATSVIISSCASGSINRYILSEKALSKELTIFGKDNTHVYGKKVYFDGYFVGFTYKEGNKYYNIAIDNVRIFRNNIKRAILLLPVSDNGTPVLCETNENKYGYSDKVSVVIQEGLPSSIEPDFKNYKYIWETYPKNIAISYDLIGTNRYSNLVVRYSTGPSDADLQTREIIDSMEWRERSKFKYYGLKALYPIGVVLDVVTFPIQFILWITYFHV